jgi:dinuclear metal center YbgI/SA1388 family protein
VACVVQAENVHGRMALGGKGDRVVARAELVQFCTSMLDAGRFRDAAVNGLQVEGAAEIRRLVAAVSASERTIRAAVEWGADALLVHHGLLWGERLGPLTGPFGARLRALFTGDLNLVAYHLPLDAHPAIGNNALFAEALGLAVVEPFAEVAGQPIGVIGTPASPFTATGLTERLRTLTEREPQVLPGGPEPLRRIGVVTGSGYSALEEAAERGCDALITGDVRESTMALARELGVTVLAGGHEATERLGVRALATILASEFGLETTFVEDPNPI